MLSPFGRLKQFAASLINAQDANEQSQTPHEADIKEEAVHQEVNSNDGHSYKDESLSFYQHEFLLNGACKVVADAPAVLVASIGQQIVGMCTLPRLSSAKSPIAQFEVHFSMQLNAEVLLGQVAEQVTFTLFNKTQSLLTSLPCSDFVLRAFASTTPVEQTAPSYGFFGGGKLEPLEIDVNRAVKSLTLIVAQQDIYLNLRDLRLFDSQGGRLTIDDSVEVTCSSSKSQAPLSANVLTGHGFHSELENSPWLTVTFQQPVEISRLEVVNRADQWGSRTQRLEISMVDDKQQHRLLYERFSDQALARFFATAVGYVGADCLLIEDQEARRKTILQRLLEKLQSNATEADQELISFSLQFLSTWSKDKPSDEILRFELRILALYIFNSTTKKLNFTLSPFSRILFRKRDMQSLESDINAYRKAAGLAPLLFTKHGIAHQGILSQNIPNVLNTLQIVIDDLSAMGLRPCIAYGTLLGAHRDGKFIPHDDDVDLLVEFSDQNLNKEKAFALTEKLLSDLDPDKYRTDLETRAGNNLNIHILVKQTNMVVDIFPYWNEGDASYLHMEKMKIRAIPADILAQRTEVKLYDKSFPAPAKIEPFLLERYGEGWPISDKFHEWPWALKE